VLKISALTGKGVHKLRPCSGRDRAVPPPGAHPRRQQGDRRAQQQAAGRRGAKVLYAVQGATDPPTFTLFARPQALLLIERVPCALV
jgi:GTPase